MGFFSWVRSSVKSAVLAGFQDAHDELLSVNYEVSPVTLRLGHVEEAEVEEPSQRKTRNRS